MLSRLLVFRVTAVTHVSLLVDHDFSSATGHLKYPFKEKEMNEKNETQPEHSIRQTRYLPRSIPRAVALSLIALTISACSGGRSGSGVVEVGEALAMASGVSRAAEASAPASDRSTGVAEARDADADEGNTGTNDDTIREDEPLDDNTASDEEKSRKGKGHGKGGNPDKKGHGMGGNPDKNGHGKGGVTN